jgi:hypothetical protein
MPAAQLHVSPAGIGTSVSETIKRINAGVMDLVAKRAEIDSRIRLVQQVMRRLRYLGARKMSGARYARSIDSLRTVTTPGEDAAMMAR